MIERTRDEILEAEAIQAERPAPEPQGLERYDIAAVMELGRHSI